MTLNAHTYEEQAGRLMQVLADEGASAREFGELFWALAWWRAQSAAADPATSQADAALAQACAALRAAALRAWHGLLGCKDLAGLGEVHGAISRLEALNIQLLAGPSSFGLSEDLELPAFVQPFDPSWLREWLAAIAIWQRAAQAEAPARRADAAGRAQLTDAIVRLRELADTGRQLLHPVKLALFPGEVVDGASLQALQQAAGAYIELADVVRKILAGQAQQNPIAVLAELDRKVDLARSAQPHWLTARLYATIAGHAGALESQLKQATGALVAEVLGDADPEFAAQRLYEEVLLPCATLPLADAVEAALRPYLLPAADTRPRRAGDRPDPRLAQVRIIQLALSKLAASGQALEENSI